MKRKILSIVLCSFLLTGVVSAASLWGSYKGNQIIRLSVDGVPVKVNDVPAISYNGRTMIPIYLLSQAGVQYQWDDRNQTVDIKQQNNGGGSATKADLSVWADVADYFHELDSISSDFYNSKTHLDIIATSLIGGASVESVEKGLKDATERLKSLKTDYSDLQHRYSNNTYAKMTSMKYSSTKLANIELSYTTALNTMLESVLILVEWNRTNNQTLADEYYKKSMSANSDIGMAKFESGNEFKIFLNAIIVGE